MDEPLDPYLELGVPQRASAAEITNAYHHLVRLLHPDTRPPTAYAAASDAALVRIMAAYAILKHPARRQHYDRQHPGPIPRSHHRRSTPLVWIGPRAPDSITVTPVRWHGPPTRPP
jgi:curved DNA-binding protein CbpA